MEANHMAGSQPNRRLFIILLGAVSLLIIPLVLQVAIGTGVDGQGFNWKVNDFVIMGSMLLITGFIIEIILRKVKTTTSRILLFGVALFMFVLLWAELAVGLFGSPLAGS